MESGQSLVTPFLKSTALRPRKPSKNMTDRTKEFRTCVEEKRGLYPPDLKGKGKGRRDAGSNDADAQNGRITAKAYLQEAYIIVST